MLVYVARRILLAVPTVFGVATAVFIMLRLLPGDTALTIAGLLASRADVETIRHQLGLDLPLWVQYGRFITGLIGGDLGISARTGESVLGEIVARLPYTYGLALASSAIAIPLGLAAGIFAATRRGTLLDLIVSGAAIFGLSMPVYWLGLMLIVLFSIQLRILPAAGSGEVLGFVLPSMTLALGLIAVVSRQSRSAMLEVLGQEYVRTARSKGLSPSAVVIVHALRNALLPVVTAVGLQFGHLLGGAVIVEYVFSWPGIGRFLVESIFARDYPAVQGVILLLSISFIAVNLLVDVLYAYIDPRIRYA